MNAVIVQFLCLCFTSLLFKIEGSCHFPASWHGTWFQAGIHYPITIQKNSISFRGNCVSHHGYKFLLKDSKRNCYRCLAINERHRNVLQYKESYCDQKQSLRELCGRITGDTILYSLLRSDNARPIPCPLRGEFRMEYQRGWGWCKTPVSEIHRCTSDTSMFFRFHACPDIRGSESSAEELQCLATWKEGSTHYLVGKFFHHLAKSDEDRFRCFVYERLKGEVTYHLAQSGDGTCNGMFSATEGARTMRLVKVKDTQPECFFPSWLTYHKRLHTLDNRDTWHVMERNSSIHVLSEGRVKERLVCHHNVEYTTRSTAKIIVRLTQGCKSGYVCMLFYKRDNHVLELQRGTSTRFPDQACTRDYFDERTLPYTTLITAAVGKRECPHSGQYQIASIRWTGSERGVCQADLRGLRMGCLQADTIELTTDNCPSQPTSNTAYTCHGHWTENETHYLVASPVSRSSTGARRLCFIYRSSRETRTIHFSTVSESCHRGEVPGVTGVMAFNVTTPVGCGEISCGVRCLLSCPLLFFLLMCSCDVWR